MSQKLLSFLKVGSKQSYQLIPKSKITNDLFQCQLCYIGEKHNFKTILQSQLEILNTFKQCNQYQHEPQKIAIILEMFNMNQQQLLNKYYSSNNNSFGLKELQTEYDANGIEGFDIENHYGKLLEFTKENANIFHVFGGFPPRSMAKLFLNKDINDQTLWKQIFNLLNLDNNNDENKEENELMELLKDMILRGNEKHYQYFYYLLSDQVLPFNKMVRDEQTGLFEKYGKIFVAQCFKDTVMAYNIIKLWLTKKYDKIVIIAGHGHLDCKYGVYERVEQLLQFKKVDVSEIKKVILSCQIEKELEDTPFIDTVSDYILFLESSDV